MDHGATKEGNLGGRGIQEPVDLNLLSGLFCFLSLQGWAILNGPSLYCKRVFFFFFFISRSRRANMVPGQLQPQLLLDQCLTEESRSSGLRSPRPLPKLIKTWTPILSGEMHWPRTPLLPWRWQAAGSAPQTLPRGLPEGRPPRGEGRDALRHQPALCRAQTRLPKPGAQGHLRMNSSARLPDRQADFKGALRHCPLKDPKDPRNSIGVSNRIKMFQQLSLLLK